MSANGAGEFSLRLNWVVLLLVIGCGSSRLYRQEKTSSTAQLISSLIPLISLFTQHSTHSILFTLLNSFFWLVDEMREWSLMLFASSIEFNEFKLRNVWLCVSSPNNLFLPSLSSTIKLISLLIQSIIYFSLLIIGWFLFEFDGIDLNYDWLIGLDGRRLASGP